MKQRNIWSGWPKGPTTAFLVGVKLPTKADADAINTSLDWQEFYQYGSNLGEINADKKWLQDGVAPQFGVGNMQGHRVFIPNKDAAGNDVPKGYFNSHSIGNYGWVFKILPTDPLGYVTPK